MNIPHTLFFQYAHTLLGNLQQRVVLGLSNQNNASAESAHLRRRNAELLEKLEAAKQESCEHLHALETEKKKTANLRKKNRFLNQLVTRDALTGISNRRSFNQKTESLSKKAKRDGHQLIVAMLDIDHFKSINDTYGHKFGDIVLHAFAYRLTQSLRPTTFVARYGGEEFILVEQCAESDKDVAIASMTQRLAHHPDGNLIVWKENREICLGEDLADGQRIRISHDEHGNLLRTSVATKQNAVKEITMSGGVAAFDPADETMNICVGRADEALYCSKHSGRNRMSRHRLGGYFNQVLINLIRNRGLDSDQAHDPTPHCPHQGRCPVASCLKNTGPEG